MTLDTDGHIIVPDFCNSCIRKVTTAEGRVTMVAGSAEAGPGFADSTASAARFNSLSAITVDCNKNILVTDQNNNRIRMIACKGVRSTTLAGSAEEGRVDNTDDYIRFNNPNDVALDEWGRLLVLECENAGSVRAVEAPPQLLVLKVLPVMAPPQRLVHKVQPVKNPLVIPLEDYSKLREDIELSDVTLAVDGQLLSTPLRAGGAEPLLSRPVQVGAGHVQEWGVRGWPGHRDQRRECLCILRATAVPVHTHAPRGGGLRGGADSGGDGACSRLVPGERAVCALHGAVQ